MKHRLFSPFWLPVWLYVLVILCGTAVLGLAPCHDGELEFVDALFTSVSAVCVTGLVVVDTGSYFNGLGQGVILGLIQLGGLGIMTYTTLALVLFGKRVSLSDRIAVSQTLLHDPSFNLVRFILKVVSGAICIELAGALALYWLDPRGFSPWSALFHSISAFCNAGFGLFADSLVGFNRDLGVNLVFIVLITLGGLGFAVLHELADLPKALLAKLGVIRPKGPRGECCLAWPSRVVLQTSLFLTLGGALAIFLAEVSGAHRSAPLADLALESLFQSVTCRTAGFNTLDIGLMSNVSLVIMMGLMVVGGSPGSCAGGIKTTTLRVWWGFIRAQFQGREQVRVGRFAVDQGSLNKALTLVIYAFFFIGAATLLLLVAEGGIEAHPTARAGLLETLFETVSAFGTVGLSMGLTAGLTTSSKLVISLLMFIGRLGPIWLLTALQSWQAEPRYRLPEKTLPLG